MATRRERNNLASKKSYERAQERAHATDYEFAVVERHRAQTGDEAWHWSVVPEDHLFEAGYIHNFAKHRLMRLMNKKRMEEGENRLRDYGLDGLARGVTETGEVVYHGLQAKYYTSRSVTAEDIGSFLAKQISMTLANPLSRGYLYTTTRLQVVNKEKRIPYSKEIYEKIRVGEYWNSVKSGAVNRELYRTLLSTNPLLKVDYDRLQLLKQQKKNST